jgi:hypothetical protein
MSTNLYTSRLLVPNRTEGHGPICFKFLLLLLLLSLCVFPRTTTLAASPEEMLCRATVMSTGPPFVLVTVINSQTGDRFIRAVTSVRLQVALSREHGFGGQRLFEFIYQHSDLRFEFSNQHALNQLLSPDAGRYTEWLEEARQALIGLDNAQIFAGFAPGGTLHNLYWYSYDADARIRPVAHALLERGFFPTATDIPGTICLTCGHEC